jgi:ATP-dependent RNA helicase HelY
VETLDLLVKESLLPAIVFVFSRAGCEQAVEQCSASGAQLTTADEAKRIRAIADAHTAGLDDDDLAVLGYGSWRAGLEAGLASHHAGLVPPMKEAVEEAFAAGLVKVVFATETLALGINMPARSVVIEKLTKFTGEHHEMLTPGEYTQLTGRAGRRGIDDVGYAVVCWSPWVPFEQVAGLASRRTDALRSSFRPTYNMTVNLVRRYSSENAHRLLNLSFAQFHTDRDVVALERQLERTHADLARERERAARDHRPSRVDRLERDVKRLERRVRSRSESLARQLDQVRSVLESWGYVDGWALSSAGEMLARLYTETDLLLAESLRDGLLDGLKVPELAAVVSCFSYERRGSDGADPAPPARWPSGRVAERARGIEKLWRALSANESDAGLPETRPPDPGFTPYAHEWANGEDLGAILDDDELAGGDFVRNIKQCVDLLGQIADVAPEADTRDTARRAIDACMRGVIRLAAVVTS